MADAHPRQSESAISERDSFRRKSAAHDAWMDAIDARLRAEETEKVWKAAYDREAERHHREFGEDA